MMGTYLGGGAFAVMGALASYYLADSAALAVLAAILAAAGVWILGIASELLRSQRRRATRRWRVEERPVPGQHGVTLIGTDNFPTDTRLLCIARTPADLHVVLPIVRLAPIAFAADISDQAIGPGESEFRWYSIDSDGNQHELVRAKLVISQKV